VIARVLSIPAKRFDRRIVSFLTAEESVALIAAAPENRWEGRRDRAMLTLALHAGLRVSELIAVDCADIELGTAAHVRVEGKGRKQRAVPLSKDAQAVLAVWLDERAGLPDDPLFPTRTGRRLTRDAVERRVATHAATAAQRCPSLAGKRVHPHALRHSCAMSLLQARVDSTVIALWLGHADTGSTQQYIHADMTIKERALALLAPPTATPGRYTPTDDVLAYLDGLG
jgi:site-specific recombinase XerC